MFVLLTRHVREWLAQCNAGALSTRNLLEKRNRVFGALPEPTKTSAAAPPVKGHPAP